MHIIDIQDRKGFELVVGKKKKYLFKTANPDERDQWVEVLKKYAEISSSSSSTSADLLPPSASKDKEKQ